MKSYAGTTLGGYGQQFWTQIQALNYELRLNLFQKPTGATAHVQKHLRMRPTRAYHVDYTCGGLIVLDERVHLIIKLSGMSVHGDYLAAT